jgi:hypothetical protein
MTVGDWSDTTDFWTNPPPLIISAAKVNTMFLNTWRLYKGMERFHESQFHDYYEYTFAGGGGTWYYAFRITDDCPWNRLTIIEKLQSTGLGSGNLQLVVTHVGVGALIDTTIDCSSFPSASWTWYKVLDAHDISGWAAGNHEISVFWRPTNVAGCTSLKSKCRHSMLETNLT